MLHPQHRQTHDDGIYCTGIVSHNKNMPNSSLADIFSKKSSSTSYQLSPQPVPPKYFVKSCVATLTQRIDLPASYATSCAKSTANDSNHSAVGTLHPHCSASFSLYITLCGPIRPSSKNAPPPKMPLHVGGFPPYQKKHPLAHRTHHPKWYNLLSIVFEKLA